MIMLYIACCQVASQRADLGAIQNRLESTVSNLQVTSENLNAANSRIQDADFAAALSWKGSSPPVLGGVVRVPVSSAFVPGLRRR